MLEQIRADLAAHGGRWSAQGFWALVVYRCGRWTYSLQSQVLRKGVGLLYREAFECVQILTGNGWLRAVVIGRNFVIDHFGGIVISGYARFGGNGRMCNGVVLQFPGIEDPRAPVIGNNVDIGAGPKVGGRITVGDHCLIGANAVVVCDVPRIAGCCWGASRRKTSQA